VRKRLPHDRSEAHLCGNLIDSVSRTLRGGLRICLVRSLHLREDDQRPRDLDGLRGLHGHG
jgi:hypothetical protein